jgi:hypothetical protein
VDNTNFILSVNAKLKTGSGFKPFNGVNIESAVTHTFTIRYVDLVIESRFMIWFNGEFYHIDNIINKDEDNLYLIFKATKRGEDTFEANNF